MEFGAWGDEMRVLDRLRFGSWGPEFWWGSVSRISVGWGVAWAVGVDFSGAMVVGGSELWSD